jgi:hypothetical protein
MLSQKRHVLTIAAVIATVASVGAVGAAQIAAPHTQAHPAAQPVVVAPAAPVVSQHYDDFGGGDQ